MAREQKPFKQFIKDRGYDNWHTPDLPDLNQWKNHHVFIYDDHKFGFKGHDGLLRNAPLVAMGFTHLNFDMYIMPGNKPFPIIFSVTNILPAGSKAAKVMGEVYLVDTHTLMKLDFDCMNTYEMNRTKVFVELLTVPSKQLVPVHCYIGNREAWSKKFHMMAQKHPRGDHKAIKTPYLNYSTQDQIHYSKIHGGARGSSEYWPL